MIEFTFKKPPTFTLMTYFIGFIFIGFTVTHQTLSLSLISSVLNQQIFIVGAIVVTVGSIYSWVSPYFSQQPSKDDKQEKHDE